MDIFIFLRMKFSLLILKHFWWSTSVDITLMNVLSAFVVSATFLEVNVADIRKAPEAATFSSPKNLEY